MRRAPFPSMACILVAPALVGFAFACSSSSGGLSASGVSISCAPSMYILNGQCADLPVFSDVVLLSASDGDDTSDVISSEEGAPDGDASFDAPEPADDGVANPAESGDSPPEANGGAGDANEAGESAAGGDGSATPGER